MIKEKLEKIKDAWHIDGDITDYHFYWLIEQTERAQELEKELYGNDIQMGYKQKYKECNRGYARLFQQNRRYHEYLRRLQRATRRYPAEDMVYVVNKITNEALEE